MPYETIADLPAAVKQALPKAAQQIFLAAFNAASKEYDDEKKAFQTAWAAVKQKYEQDKDGNWTKKEGRGMAETAHAAMPMLTRLMAAFAPRTADPEARTVEVTWTTGATVRRQGLFGPAFDETLLMDDENVDLGRLNRGAPVLDSHQAVGLAHILGVVEDGSASLLGPKGQRKGKATIRFSDRPEVEPVWRDVQAGIIRNVSVGYSVGEWQRVDPPPTATGRDAVPLMRAVRWIPHEISLVAVPADAGASVRHGTDAYPCTITTVRSHQGMTTASGAASEAADLIRTTESTPPPEPSPPPPPPPAGEEEPSGVRAGQGAEAVPGMTPAECATVLRSAAGLGLPTDYAIGLVAHDGMTLARARELMIDERARGQGGTHVAARHVVTVRDEVETRCGAIRDAILHGQLPGLFPLPPDSPAREYAGLRLVELARVELEAAGIRTRGRSPAWVASLALQPGYGVRQPGWLGIRADTGYHTTSDLSSVFLDVVYKSARAAYTAAPQTFQLWAKRSTRRDYRLASSVQLSGLGSLTKVPEHGEYVYGTLTDSKEAYKVEKFGKIIGITREAIINDDLGLLTDIPARLGTAARNTESDVVYAALLANAAMGADGIPLFHANHGNLASATAISSTSLESAYSAMAMQKDPDGVTMLAITPRYLLVPPAKLGEASRTLGTYFPATTANATAPYLRSLVPVDEPRLQGGVTVGGVTYAGSSTQWYLAADPNQAPTVEYAYLEGQEGVYTETQAGFDIDGIKTKVRLDIGAKPIDWRGLQMNPGA
jgi:cation transport regulator ChaB